VNSLFERQIVRLSMSLWLLAHAMLNSRLYAAELTAVSSPTSTELMTVVNPPAQIVDPSGPLKTTIPPGLCGMQFPALNGLPPDNPVARQTGAPLTLAEKTYFSNLNLKELQSTHCAPVLSTETAAKARAPLPPACTQPPEAAAIEDPIHPLADLSRADVRAAEQIYRAALARVTALRKQCLEIATGVPAVNAPAPQALQ
jgi:hypothetical protein